MHSNTKLTQKTSAFCACNVAFARSKPGKLQKMKGEIKMSSFFMEYEFSECVSGFPGQFHGEKIYDLYSVESIERLIDDALRVLKERRDSMVTFQLFTGYESVDLLRLFRSAGYDGSRMTEVFWKRNESGFVTETRTTENIEINKRNVRKSVYKATSMFFEKSK